MSSMLGNIFVNIPRVLPEEFFEILFQKPGVKIERIVSKGHVTPEDEWYDQDWDEWVMLLQGSATIRFEKTTVVNLMPGDYCLIPARTRHCVTRTESEPETIWLAVHCR